MKTKTVVSACNHAAEGNAAYAVWTLDSPTVQLLLAYLDMARNCLQSAPVREITLAPDRVAITFTTWEPFRDIQSDLDKDGILILDGLPPAVAACTVEVMRLVLVVDPAQQTLQARALESWGFVRTHDVSRAVLERLQTATDGE